MTATTTATSQAVAEWIRVFPKEVTESITSSTTFMKQLTTIALSIITYLKNTFPEENYMLEQFAGVKLRVLKKKCRDELAQFLCTSLTQAFDAIDKKYLHQLALCFYDKECKIENLVEYHLFEYSYSDAGAAMNLQSSSRDGSRSNRFSFENVRERTVHLIRACVVIMESCQELPENYVLGLRLYYNDSAPEEYQAPGFLPAEGADHIAPLAPQSVKLGWVATPYHRLTARAYMRDQAPPSHEAQASQNDPVLLDTNASDDQNMSVSGCEPQLICSCRRLDAEDEMLSCQYCHTRQHAACYGVVGAARAHCCVHCSDADFARVPTDTRLAALEDKQREALCIFRRTLVWCGAVGAAGASGAALASALQLSASNAARLLRVLRRCGVLPDSDDSFDTPQPVQPDALKSVMNKYFQSDIVERLAAESVASEPDPLGEVLSPMERVSLQATMGRVIDNSQELVLSNQSNVPTTSDGTDNPGVDSTLKEYREAFVGDSEEPMRELRSSKRKIDQPPKMGVQAKRAKANKK